jgi:predicted small secreted protein
MLSGFTIAACNVGATVAGTGYSIQTSGKKFQRGNNNGWMDDDMPTTGTTQTSTPSTTFIICNNTNSYCNNTHDWKTSQDDTLR